MKLKPIEEIVLTRRTAIRAGDTVRLSGGPFYLAASGERLPMGLKGKFRIVRLFSSARGASKLLEVSGLDQTAGTFTVKVEGKTTKSNGINWRSFKVKKLRSV